MRAAVVLVVVFSLTAQSDAYYIFLRRTKRQDKEQVDLPKEDYNLPPPSGTFNPFPSGNSPFPGRSASNLSPNWPFSHQFSNGMDINPGNIASLSGNLNIPIKEWGAVWDLKGKFDGGPAHTWYNYGHLLQPVNPYHLPPQTIAEWSQSPEFQAARANASVVPVAQLPSGWRPVHCKPPMCNPFVHTFDTGLQVFPSSGGWFQGGLDFPIPVSAPGQGVRFPLSGGMFAGTQPINVNYGQHINPIDPFKSYSPNKVKPKQPIGSNVNPFESAQQLLPPRDQLVSQPTDDFLRSQPRQRQWPKQTQTAAQTRMQSGSLDQNGKIFAGIPASGTLPLVTPPPIPGK